MNPRFTDKDGNNEYIWETLPELEGSDRADATTDGREESLTIHHTRHGVPYARSVLVLRRAWHFRWTAISEAEIKEYRYFHDLDYFRFYPTGSGQYYLVYIPDTAFTPEPIRHNAYNLTIILREYGDDTETE